MPLYFAIPCVEGRKGPIPYTEATSLEEAVRQFFGVGVECTVVHPDCCRVKLPDKREFEVARAEEIAEGGP